MKIPKLVFSYISLLLGILGLSLFLHLKAQVSLGITKWADQLFLSYFINMVLALAIFFTLYGLRNKYKNQIGFLYMGGSFLKFLVFFIVFYPGYRMDGDVTRSEFASFFVPYLICLVLETVYTAKILLRKD
jgi:hypothetical protein